jgi:hypothetical protein
LRSGEVAEEKMEKVEMTVINREAWLRNLHGLIAIEATAKMIAPRLIENISKTCSMEGPAADRVDEYFWFRP